jgi:hypothetical protein
MVHPTWVALLGQPYFNEMDKHSIQCFLLDENIALEMVHAYWVALLGHNVIVTGTDIYERPMMKTNENAAICKRFLSICSFYLVDLNITAYHFRRGLKWYEYVQVMANGKFYLSEP